MVKSFKQSFQQDSLDKQDRGWGTVRSLIRRVAHPVDSAEMQIEGVNSVPGRPGDIHPGDVERPSPPSNRSPKQPLPQERTWHWTIVWLIALAIFGGMGTAAVLWLVTLPPQVNCRQPEKLSLDMERLYCAQEAAQTGDLAKLISGIELLKQWQPDHPLHNEAQRLIKEWSSQVLNQANRKVEQGDLKGAEAALSHIPASTSVYADAQKALSRWRKYSKNAADIYAKAQSALKQKDWDTVAKQIVLLAEFERDYWNLENGATALGQQLGAEKQAWKVLSQAQKMAGNSPQQLSAAITEALKVPDKTYAAAAAKENLRQWSQKLVLIGVQKWQKNDQAGAVTTLQVAGDLTNTPEIDDLYRFGNAYRLANLAFSEKWVPSAGGVVNLMEAIAAINQVKSASPFYGLAQSYKRNWQAQLKDVIQLKYAGAVASLGQPAALQLAIGQAKQISADHPRRVQAQSLVAYWQQEIQRVEDQPILDSATRLAKAGQIDSLKAAIAQASQIERGRALRQQAQTLIASWTSQIQTLEDRPKLDQAWQWARQDKLDQAIQLASQIHAGRSLYGEAQSAIADWRYQQIVNAQIAQDQPILNQANALADAGNLSAAISAASQIGPHRALSSQAQAAISRWQEQLSPPRPAPLPPIEQPGDPLPSEQPTPNSDQGVNSFPSPTLVPSNNGMPSSIQLEPAPATAPEMVPVHPVPSSGMVPGAPGASASEPASPAYTYEPAAPQPSASQAADPLPPRAIDPLPPHP